MSTHRSRTTAQRHGEKLARGVACKQAREMRGLLAVLLRPCLQVAKTTRTSPGSLYSYNSHVTRLPKNDSTPEQLASPCHLLSLT